MKTLYLIRHGKGAPRQKKQPDCERPLSKIGKREVKALTQHLRQRQIAPDVMLCAPTERVRQTAAMIARALDCAPEAAVSYDLAASNDPAQLLQLIHSQPDTANVVLLIGHHPALSVVAQTFAPALDATLCTSSVVGLQFACNAWADVSADTARLMLYDFPARLTSKVTRDFQRLISVQLIHVMQGIVKPDAARLPDALVEAVRQASSPLAEALLAELCAPSPATTPEGLPAEPSTDAPPSAPMIDTPVPDESEATPTVVAPKKPKRAKTGSPN